MSIKLLFAGLAAVASTAHADPTPAAVQRARTCLPESYGARHDGTSDDTRALQKAIDACAGGGMVRLAAGTYLSGPVFLHSHETLEVAKGAMLQGVPEHERYLRPGSAPVGLINAKDERDIALTGGGVIDGNGQSWWPGARASKAKGIEPPRPKMIMLTGIDGLVVRGLTLQNSPMFHLVPARSHNVLIEDLTIHSPANAPNTDGIDPSGRDMLIQNVDVDTGDDNIAIKSGADDPQHPGAATANILIRNSTFRHGHGLSIGSETNGGVHNVLADNITFDGTTQAIRIKTPRGRGGIVSNIVYRNIRMANVGQAILITTYYPKIPDAADPAQPIGPKTPDISNIVLQNVTGETGIKRLGTIVGLPERPVRGVVLQNVKLRGEGALQIRNASVRLEHSDLAVAAGKPLNIEAGGEVTGAP